ncbi:MAG: hypothetical protein Q9173_001636 [Seirophora scorigena]
MSFAAFWGVYAAVHYPVDFPDPWSVTPKMIEKVPVSDGGGIGAQHSRKTDLPRTIGTEKLQVIVSFRFEGSAPTFARKQGNV